MPYQDREVRLAYYRARYQEKRDDILEKQRGRYEDNKERYRASRRARYIPQPPTVRECLWCAQAFEAVGRQLYCSRRCSALYRRRRGRPDRRCLVCGSIFARTTRIDAKTCSTTCTLALYRAKNPERVTEWKYQAKLRRRAREKSVEYETIDRHVIYDRDKGLCHLCGRKVGRRTFQLDHLVPVALGGGTVAANLRVAHPSCNQRKSTRAMNEQLMLIG